LLRYGLESSKSLAGNVFLAAILTGHRPVRPPAEIDSELDTGHLELQLKLTGFDRHWSVRTAR